VGQVIQNRIPAPKAPDPGSRFEPLFPRAHKLALGMAFGLTVGIGIFAITAFHLVLRPTPGLPLHLLNQYFSGYSVTWLGAMLGFLWGFGTGFVAGWLLGFVHNFTIGVWMLIVRTRQDFKDTKNFLDHI
jgi:hypothetical protein